MTITREESFRTFGFWSGAKERADLLTSEELDMLEEMYVECFGEPASATDVNDFLWFADDTWAQWLGYSNYEELSLERSGSEDV